MYLLLILSKSWLCVSLCVEKEVNLKEQDIVKPLSWDGFLEIRDKILGAFLEYGNDFHIFGGPVVVLALTPKTLAFRLKCLYDGSEGKWKSYTNKVFDIDFPRDKVLKMGIIESGDFGIVFRQEHCSNPQWVHIRICKPWVTELLLTINQPSSGPQSAADDEFER